MKKVNLLYVGALVLTMIMVLMTFSMQSKTASFYGFAENKETEINHIDDVLVLKIHVENGQEVKKGELLIEVQNSILPSKIDGLKLEKEVLKKSLQQKKSEVRNKITSIELDRDIKLKDLNSKIEILEKEMALNASLYEGLTSIENSKGTSENPDRLKLKYLKQSIQDVEEKAKEEIRMQNSILATIGAPTTVKSEQLDTEIEHFQKEKEKLSIYAPSDGLIGSVSCKEGENISAFSTLMNFYKHNPTLVKGFVHESMILEVKVGDELEVSSSLHPDVHIKGKVFGLGSRIVEIPERLRKIADFKTYGREVLIKIPEENDFLQKEKVLLNTITENTGMKLGNLFSSKKPLSENIEQVDNENNR
ncbi:MAG: efflux RND transporter periplasmic adaptor subunit [Saprospiraceae bacterium]|nr:efflux RND transporter periplasmic adaptor subunit [Saprospiraceae bacterium]